jgi:NAD(P)-dependent dehydrogenase (short-subunit alcohol dehydrogenase family)
MAHIQFDSSLLSSLNNKVVVLTGGATGIGRSCIQQLCGKTHKAQACYVGHLIGI